jgi:hypothetical protein
MAPIQTPPRVRFWKEEYANFVWQIRSCLGSFNYRRCGKEEYQIQCDKSEIESFTFKSW